jgi:hypothetical protein
MRSSINTIVTDILRRYRGQGATAVAVGDLPTRPFRVHLQPPSRAR